eukprot:scaffold48121_cov47-Attheya_sp.AAC.7
MGETGHIRWRHVALSTPFVSRYLGPKGTTTQGLDISSTCKEKTSDTDSIQIKKVVKPLAAERYQHRLQELREYKAINGDTYVPVGYPQNRKLANWVKTQRSEYEKFYHGKDSHLTQERIQCLRDLGFDFQYPVRAGINMISGMRVQNVSIATTLNDPASSDVSVSWNEKYEALVEYKKDHGHSRVPQRNKANPGLGNWVKKQRNDYAKLQRGQHSAISQDRIDKLNEIDFIWNLKTSGQSANDAIWMNFLEELRGFKKEHGHCNVPLKHGPLGKWVSTQRYRYRQRIMDNNSDLVDDRLRLLEELGFEFDTSSLQAALQSHIWEQRFEELCQFQVIHNHMDVPTNNTRLKGWIQAQRREYRKRLLSAPKSSNSLVTPDRIQDLEAIGFQWNVHDVKWMKFFEELKAFYNEHDRSSSPSIYAQNPALGRWITVQRRLYREFQRGEQSPMTQERIKLLNEIEFVWEVRRE